MKEIFEWDRVFMNDLPYVFLLEVLFRCLVMFIVVLIALKLTGKRGIKQLSIFELVIIITLGSAAGDPMFYEDVGLIPAITVFICVLAFYRAITWALKFKKFEHWIEGKPVTLIVDGEFVKQRMEKEDIAVDEFYAELRMEHVDHLGQVKLAILEVSGEISVFFNADEEVKYGLPILPHEIRTPLKKIAENGMYACNTCGKVYQLTICEEATCSNCHKKHWIRARNNLRIS
ncbi:YetF domain-containing protein [Pedobacter glucosidilyticus]|uniref:YetF domain-containing protein n=1 Tax=Pedobacter glucosidilyticus TaxID=1122941 RepID=UPI0026EE85A3|nr:YetF domain-containing protein [Pedobacter glucosidilyticus]